MSGAFVNWKTQDATVRMLSAPRGTPERLEWARRLVRAKFERGDYEMLQALDVDTCERMAKELAEAP